MTNRMLEVQKLDKLRWGEAVANAIYTLNQCLTRVLCFVTSKTIWSGRKPCVVHMRVFGSFPYAMVPDKKRGKLDTE